MLWGIKTSTGTPVLPSYKGKRGSSPWEFSVDKKYWQAYKDEYAKELAPFFRAKAVKCDVAEGDDMIYASVKKYAGDYDDVIVITRDSDMSQIDVKNLKIFNHTSETFVECAYPQAYLAAKVLSGDTSDNIRGMAFVDAKTGELKPSKANGVSEKEAVMLMENCPNIYAVADANGWADQYMRNRTLIDLSMVPRDVAELADDELDKAAPEIDPDWSKANDWGIPESKVDYYRTLQQFGFFSVIARDNANPESFKGSQLVKKEAEINKKLMDDMASGLDFDDIDGAFGGPEFDIDAL
jgi:5'-3' exonuclease